MFRRSCYVFLGLFVLAASLRASASTVRGVVTDPTGAPIPQASVGLYSTDGDWDTTTDAGGTFSFDGIVPGMYELQIKSQGFIPKLITDFNVGETDPPLTAIKLQVGSCPPCCGSNSLCTIADVTYKETQGKPMLQGQLFTSCKEWTRANVSVTLGRSETPRTIATVTTGRDGKFQFKDIEPGRYYLWFSGVGKHPDFADFNIRIKHRKIAVLRERISEEWISVTLSCPTPVKTGKLAKYSTTP